MATSVLVTLQSGAYAADPAYFKHITNTWVPGVPPLYSPIPGDDSTFQSFRATAGVMDQN